MKNNQINVIKNIVFLNYMKNYISQQRNIIDSQGCYCLMKTYRANLRVEMNNKDNLIMH